MIEMEIPGYGEVRLEYLVMDYNGTLAVDGQLLPGVANRLRLLATKLSLYVVTADTFGTVKKQLHQLPVEILILGDSHGHAQAKEAYVEDLGPEKTAAIGNGRNDRLMLARAQVGVAVVLREGASSVAVGEADIVTTGIEDALDLFIHPLRLKATLRS